MVSDNLTEAFSIEGAETGLKLALSCCEIFMKNKAVSSAGDMSGVVFMRTGTSSSADFSGIYTVQNLNFVDAPRILEIRKLRQMSSEKFAEVYGSLPAEESFPVHEALWACQTMFSKVSFSLGYKRIWLFTDDHNPVGNKAQLQRQAILKAVDLRQSGIELEVLPVSREREFFCMETFYGQLLHDEPDVDSLPTNLTQRIADLLSHGSSLEPSRRRASRLPFFLVPSTAQALTTEGEPSHALAFGVSIYCLVRPAVRPRPVRLFAPANELVTVKRRYYKVCNDAHPHRGVCTDPENIVLPQDLVKGLRAGSRTVYFENAELSGRSRQFVAVGIHLLGFKPLKRLKPWYHLRAAQFVYPDEGLAKGSTLWFTTLLSVCLRRQIFAIALYVQRRGMPPRLVALVPQAEKLNENRSQIVSSGFHLVHLPYQEDVRQLTLPKSAPDLVANPRLQRHYAELEALALELPSPKEVPDHTLPNFQQIKERAGKEIEAFAALLHRHASFEGQLSSSLAKKVAHSPSTLAAAELRNDSPGSSEAIDCIPHR
uniref:Ku domain-containing protein n=1 Tax=Mesocestoides corti TaxID=53468 RepID=A0A5K3EZ85_MESCO